MAIIVEIKKTDTKKTIKEKLAALQESGDKLKRFDASKFTGKIKSFGGGIEYQKKIRDEWN